MNQPEKETRMEYRADAEWSYCPKCGEKISLVRKSDKTRGETRAIVVIDDELGIRDLLEIAFDAEGYEFMGFEQAGEGLNLIRAHKPDLVFLDIRLPDMNGLEALKQIKSIDPEIAVIMITAYGDSKDALKCMKLGAVAYVTKPFDVHYVRMLVRNELE